MSRDDFIQSIYVLEQLRNGWLNNPWDNDFMAGFFNSVTLWISGAYEKSYYVPDDSWDAQSGFRLVVDSRQSVTNTRSKEFMRGYVTGLRMFRHAKGLS